jgi:hypothetical protein
MAAMAGNSAAGTVATRFPNPEIIELDDFHGPDVTVQKKPSRIHNFFHRKKATEFVMPEKDADVLRKVKSRAYLLDRGFKICCCNIGIDPIIGLIPIIGDAAGVLLSLMTVNMASAAGLPSSLLMQMYFNVAIDGLLGFIPLLGDIADYFYRCNTRNAILLETYLVQRGKDYTLVHHGQLPAAEFHQRYPEFAASHLETKPKKHGGAGGVGPSTAGRVTGAGGRSDNMVEQGGAGKRSSVVILDQTAQNYGLDYNEIPRNAAGSKGGGVPRNGAVPRS